MSSPIKLRISLILNLFLILAFISFVFLTQTKTEPATKPLNPTTSDYKPIPYIMPEAGLPTGLINNTYPTKACGHSVDESELQLTGFRINFNYCPTIDILNYEMSTPYQILMAAAGREPEGKKIQYWMNARFIAFNVAIDHWDFLNPDPANTFVDDGSDISKFYVQNEALEQFGCIGPDPDKVKEESNGVFEIHMGQMQIRRWHGKCAPILARAKELGITVKP